MLRGIRKASSNWLGRIVMGVVLGLIAISFAVWGIGDIFRGFGRSTVAKIGSTEITVDQFRQIYNDRLQQLGRQLGRPVTQDQARQLRLDQQLVGQLVAEAAIDQRARQMRLNLSNEEIARQIMADPSFKGPSGQFERARFEAIIRNAGYTEPRFAAEQKKTTLRREIAETVSGDLNPPKTLEQAYNRYENEQRAIDYVTLDRARAGDIAPPTPDEIQSYYESQKSQFRAPEYRSAVIMTVTPAELARPENVSDADARRYYDNNLNRYGTPERRQLEQIVFPTLEEAQAAAARIGENLSFEALAKERGMEAKDIDIGVLTKSAIFDKAIADAAFALQEGGVSAPIKGTFGTVLIKAVKIEPEQVKKFEEVAPEIKQALATERARSELSARHDKIEDERGGGLRIAEIAQKLGLTARTVEAIDRSGLDPDRQAGRGPAERRRRGRSGVRRRRRRRCRAAADPRRRLCLVRRDRRDACARAQPRRRARTGRGALAQRRGFQAFARKGRRNGGQAEKRHADRRRRGGGEPSGADHVRPQARGQPQHRDLDAGGRRGVPDREGRGRHRRRQQCGRMGGVPRDRYRGLGVRRSLAGNQTHHRSDAPLAHRGHAGAVRAAPADRYRHDHQYGCAAPGLVGQHRPELMQIEPSPEAFAARYGRGEPQAVWTTLVADLETPVSAFLKIAGGRANSFLFESVEGGAVRGRYSMIGLEPDVIWRTNGSRAEINRTARAKPEAFAPCPDAPLVALRALIAESRIVLPENLPPMAAGLFGYLGYDMVRLMEELPPPNPDPVGIPDAIMIRPTVVVVFDAVKDTITVVTPVRPEAGVAATAAFSRAAERLSAIVDALDRPLDKEAAGTRSRAARGAACIQHHAGRVRRDGRAREGLHCGGRHFSGRAVATLRGALLALALRALSRAAPRQPGAVSVISSISAASRSRARARKSSCACAAAPSRCGRSPARARAARPRTRTRRWKTNCWPIRRSAPST